MSERTGAMGDPARASGGRVGEVFRASLSLGLTCFGGPIAHLAYFERRYVREQRWLSAEDYAGLVALCQSLPGPASSQVNFLVNLHRAGWRGALVGWAAFTLPSALLLWAAAIGTAHLHGPAFDALLHGLQLAAVAVVAQAVHSMGCRLCPDAATRLLALASALLLLVQGSGATPLTALALGAIGALLLGCSPIETGTTRFAMVRPGVAWSALAIATLLLALLPALALAWPRGDLALAAIFYRAGALVFGGGHVVLPLLRDALVPAGWISDDRFLAGYGLAQAVPGPLFTFAAYLGAASHGVPSPQEGAAVALFAIFLPGLLFCVAGAALWSRLDAWPSVRRALTGINASVVGILGAALWNPVCATALHGAADIAIAFAGWAALARWNVRPVALLAASVAAAQMLRALPAGTPLG